MSGNIHTRNNISAVGKSNGLRFTRAIKAIFSLLSLVLTTQFITSPVQAATYAATSVTRHATGASPACTTYPQGDDDWADITFPGGFTITFGGVSYAGTRVYSNGILAFGTDTSWYHRTYGNLTGTIGA